MCKNGPESAHRRTKATKSHNLPSLLETQDDILGHVITDDETWVYQYDPEMKRQSAQWKTANSPRPKIFRWSKSRVKTMLLTFFLILEGLFIMNLYQLDKQSTKFTIWKYWKGCVKETETTRTFCQQLMDLASRQCTCSHGTVCEGVFS